MEIEMTDQGPDDRPHHQHADHHPPRPGRAAHAADLGRRVRGQRDRPPDRERPDAAADDARPAEERDRSTSRPQVERIVVCELQGEHVLRDHPPPDGRGGSIAVDARPSDAIALALRTHRLFVEEAVIQSARSVESSKERWTSAACRSGSRASPRTSSANTRCRPVGALSTPQYLLSLTADAHAP